MNECHVSILQSILYPSESMFAIGSNCLGGSLHYETIWSQEVSLARASSTVQGPRSHLGTNISGIRLAAGKINLLLIMTT